MDLIEDEIQELPGPVDTREAPSSEAAPDKTLAEEKLPRIPNPPSDDPTDTIDDLQKGLRMRELCNYFAEMLVITVSVVTLIPRFPPPLRHQPHSLVDRPLQQRTHLPDRLGLACAEINQLLKCLENGQRRYRRA